MIELTDLECKVVREQCCHCHFWNNVEGCTYEGGSPNPLPNCFAKETAAWFVKDGVNKATHDI